MFGPLGIPELIFILVLALLIFGPKKLPEIGRTLGKGLAEFRKASNELKRSINAELIQEELRSSDPQRQLREAPQAGSLSTPVARGAATPTATAAEVLTDPGAQDSTPTKIAEPSA